MYYYWILEDFNEALKNLEKNYEITKVKLNYLKIFKNIEIEKFIIEYRDREINKKYYL